MWHENILSTIGETPLVRVNKLVPFSDLTVLAKLEFFNPAASVKDRIGLAMVEAAERDGSLKPGGTIVEGTSGNTGAGVALAAIVRGYKCIFTTTDKQSPEKADMLRALGAEVHVCPTNVEPEDPRSYYSVAKRLSEQIPNSVYLNQYDNPANTVAHYESTGPELWEQTDGRITHFIASSGTGGTISGVGKYLKERNPDIKVIGVDPFGSVYYKYFFTKEFDETQIYPYVTEGVGEDILAGNMDFDLIDDFVRVTDKDSMLTTRLLAKKEGLFVGQSSGMAMKGALQWIVDHRDDLIPDDVIVILFPDSGFRYLSKTYNDVWMRDHGFLEQTPDLAISDILNAQPTRPAVVSISPREVLGVAADMMMEHGISQLPVTEDGEVVGSITESDVLNHLIDNPEARNETVATAMGEPPPIVPQSMHLQQLVERLDSPPGAVLVEREAMNEFDIITKIDLIGILSKRILSGQNGIDSKIDPKLDS
ncbi:MAG: pyridoxal-phosphate dependent enzyme [Bacteroidetes bacterium]|nr:pyridoxal-phosphate dependent enzyme [Bacteroidota bacterium]